MTSLKTGIAYNATCRLRKEGHIEKVGSVKVKTESHPKSVLVAVWRISDSYWTPKRPQKGDVNSAADDRSASLGSGTATAATTSVTEGPTDSAPSLASEVKNGSGPAEPGNDEIRPRQGFPVHGGAGEIDPRSVREEPGAEKAREALPMGLP